MKILLIIALAGFGLGTTHAQTGANAHEGQYRNIPYDYAQLPDDIDD